MSTRKKYLLKTKNVMKQINFFIIALLCSPILMLSQDKVGIGVVNPDEKLEVAGKVFSNQGGFKFPDSTVQTTAAFNSNTADAAIPKLLGYYFHVNSIAGPVTRDLHFKDGTSMLSVANLIPVYAHTLDIVQTGEPPHTTLTISPLQIISDISIASPDLFGATLLGTLYPSGNLYLLEDIGGNEIVYSEIKLQNVRISTYDHDQIYLGDQQYAHLNGFSVSFTIITMITYFNTGNSCFCYNINAFSSCSCP